MDSFYFDLSLCVCFIAVWNERAVDDSSWKDYFLHVCWAVGPEKTDWIFTCRDCDNDECCSCQLKKNIFVLMRLVSPPHQRNAAEDQPEITHMICLSLIAGLLSTFLLRQEITTLTLIIFNHSHAANWYRLQYSLQSVSVFSHICRIWWSLPPSTIQSYQNTSLMIWQFNF